MRFISTVAFAFVVLVCASPSRIAAQDATSTRWFTIDSMPGLAVRVNMNRLRRESPTVIEAWTDLEYSSDQKPVVDSWGKWRRRLDDVYIDCDRLQIMHLMYALYRANGEEAGSYTPAESNRVWQPTAPGSLAETVAQKTCDIMQKP